MKSIRYLPCAATEIPIAVFAAGGGIANGNFAVGGYLFVIFNILFAPTLCWGIELCTANRDLPRREYVLLSCLPLLMLSFPFLEKYTGPGWTCLSWGIYFIANLAILAKLKNRLVVIFLLTFILQLCLFGCYLSI